MPITTPTYSADAQSLASRVRNHLELLYPLGDIAVLTAEVLDTMGLSLTASAPPSSPDEPHWSRNDVVLITYGDFITEPGEPPLQTLRKMVSELFSDAVSIVHLLPFYPASSDGGFAVIDHQAVAAKLGTWDDLEALASQFKLMVDLVCGHVSKSHRWVDDLRSGRSDGAECLMTATPDDDLSSVVRPRTHPLLQPIDTPTGQQHLWCTFSLDQIDIDYHQPEALLELLITLKKLLDRGAKWVRLDAIAYLWKELGTSCIHLPQTHEVVKLLRLLMNAYDSRSVLVTETNVSHEQNISYFGNGEAESSVIYNFTLAPLLVHTFLSGSAKKLHEWTVGLNECLPSATSTPATSSADSQDRTYLNFIASHDGIGLRPVEGVLSAKEIDQMIAAADQAGGTHSHYDTSDGKRPYELNVPLFDLFCSMSKMQGRPELGAASYLAAHAIMLSLPGVPAFYLHSLLCAPGVKAGDHRGTRAWQPRDFNRQKLLTSELDEMLDADQGLRRSVLEELLQLIHIRQSEPAFHPDVAYLPLPVMDGVFGLIRGGSGSDSSASDSLANETVRVVACLTNVTASTQQLSPSKLACDSPASNSPACDNKVFQAPCIDLLTRRTWSPNKQLVLAPGQTVWLVEKSSEPFDRPEPRYQPQPRRISAAERLARHSLRVTNSE